MPKKLIQQERELYYYVDGQEVIGPSSGLSGDCSGLRGKLE